MTCQQKPVYILQNSAKVVKILSKVRKTNFHERPFKNVTPGLELTKSWVAGVNIFIKMNSNLHCLSEEPFFGQETGAVLS